MRNNEVLAAKPFPEQLLATASLAWSVWEQNSSLRGKKRAAISPNDALKS